MDIKVESVVLRRMHTFVDGGIGFGARRRSNMDNEKLTLVVNALEAKTPNKEVDAALGVLTYKCLGCLHADCPGRVRFGPTVFDIKCNGTGRAVHDMYHHGNGAWNGMLMEAIELMEWEATPGQEGEDYWASISTLGGYILTLGVGSSQLDALLTAFLQAVEDRE